MVGDPATAGIGIAAGVLAFAEAALASAKFLYNQFESIKSHKDAMNRFLSELASLQTILQAVVSIASPDAPRPLTQRYANRVTLLEEPLRYCANTCKDLASGLQRCRVSDGDGKGDYFWKWLRQDFRGKKTKEAWQELERHKNTLAVALQFVSMLVRVMREKA